MKTQPQGIDRDFLNDWSRKIIHAVHKADEMQKEPFKDDAEYDAYLWNISRELFKLSEDIQRRTR